MILSLLDWKRLARIGYAASEDPDDVPQTITGIRLTVTSSSIAALALDRYVLASNQLTLETGVSGWEGVIRAKQALHVEKDIRSLDRYRSKKDHPDETIKLRIDLADEWVDVTVDETDALFPAGETITRRLDVIDGAFPNPDGVLDAAAKYKPGKPVTVLDPEKIAKLAKTVDAPWLRLRIGDPATSAVQFATTSPATGWEPDWFGLIMPVRDEGEPG